MSSPSTVVEKSKAIIWPFPPLFGILQDLPFISSVLKYHKDVFYSESEFIIVHLNHVSQPGNSCPSNGWEIFLHFFPVKFP